MRAVRAITFDVGGTLLAPWPSVGHAYAEVARHRGHNNLDPEEINRRFLAAWQARPADFDYSRAAWARLVGVVLQPHPALAADADYFARLYEYFAGPEPWRVDPEAWPVLAELRRRGFRLGVLSNWDERLRPLLGRLGLAAHFDWLGVSAEWGVHKPDPRLFHRAARALGAAPGELLHVGDSWTEDVAGARAAGALAVWLNRRGEPAPEATGPRVTSLGELPALLEGAPAPSREA